MVIKLLRNPHSIGYNLCYDSKGLIDRLRWGVGLAIGVPIRVWMEVGDGEYIALTRQKGLGKLSND